MVSFEGHADEVSFWSTSMPFQVLFSVVMLLTVTCELFTTIPLLVLFLTVTSLRSMVDLNALMPWSLSIPAPSTVRSEIVRPFATLGAITAELFGISEVAIMVWSLPLMVSAFVILIW